MIGGGVKGEKKRIERDPVKLGLLEGALAFSSNSRPYSHVYYTGAPANS